MLKFRNPYENLFFKKSTCGSVQLVGSHIKPKEQSKLEMASKYSIVLPFSSNILHDLYMNTAQFFPSSLRLDTGSSGRLYMNPKLKWCLFFPLSSLSQLSHYIFIAFTSARVTQSQIIERTHNIL